MGILESLSGVGLGFLGSIAKGVFSYVKDKQDHKHEVEMRRLDMEMLQAEGELNLKRQDIQSNEAMYSAQAATIQAAQQMQFHGHLWVEDVKGLVRPFLSLALTTFMGYMTWQALDDFVMTSELATWIVKGVLISGEAVITYWFGDRTISRVFEKKGLA